MRPAIVAMIVLATACTPKRGAIVASTTLVGAIGMGVPLGRDCQLDDHGECEHSYELYVPIGAAVGLILGLVAVATLDDDKPKPEPTQTIRFDAARSTPFTGETAEVTTYGVGFVSTCIAAKRVAVDHLETKCASPLERHSAASAPCECAHAGSHELDLCRVSLSATCATDSPHRLGFAVANTTVARDQAEVDASARCTALGGKPADLTSACTCDGDTCGCVADVACSPAGAVP